VAIQFSIASFQFEKARLDLRGPGLESHVIRFDTRSTALAPPLAAALSCQGLIMPLSGFNSGRIEVDD
jgi:hypothetical protein